MKSKIHAFNNSKRFSMRKNIIYLFIVGFFILSGKQAKAQAYPPSVQASNVQLTYKTPTGSTLTWNRGNGDYCLVVMRKSGSSLVGPPSTTTINYAASATYGNGSSLGGGDNYVVYDGTGSSVFVSGLLSNQIYYAIVYEYNSNTVFSTTYYYNNGTSGNSEGFSTLEDPPTSCGSITSASAITGSSATINFTAGGGSGRFLFIGQNSLSPSTYPTDGYYYTTSAIYGNGYYLGNSYYGMYNGSGTSASISGLSGATTYRVYDYEYTNGSYPTYSTYNYNTKNYSSCGSYTFNTTNVPPTINAISNFTVCQDVGTQAISLSGIGDGSTNESQNLSVTATSGNLTLMPNPTISYTSPGSTGTLSYKPNTGLSGTAVITVTVNDNWSVNNLTTRTFTITVKPKPGAAGAISGSSPICAGLTTQSYSIAATTNTTGYTWSVPAGFTVTAGGGTNNVTVSTTSLTTTGTMTVYAINTNGCGNGTSSTRSIQVDAQPSAPNAGPNQLTICGTSAILNATAVTTPESGVWSWLSGTPVPSIGTTTVNSTSISGLTGPTATYKYIWTVTRAASVCPSKTDTVTLSTDWNNIACQPAADYGYSPTSDVAANKVCVNTNVNFTDLSVSANQWQWDFEYSGGSPSFSSTLQNPSYTYTTTGTYTVYLRIWSNATSQFYNTTQTIEVIGAPTTPGTIFGTNSGICQGSPSQYVYSTGAVTNATVYNWTTPTGVNIDAYPSATSIAASYSTNAVSGNITVSASNSCGTSGVSTYSVTVSPLPNSNGNGISGVASVCEGQNGVVFTMSGYSNASSYAWTDLAGTQTTGTASYTVNIPLGSVSGNITVFGTNTCGDGDLVTMPLTVNPLPGAATMVSGPSSANICPTPGALMFTVNAVSNALTYNWTIPPNTTITGGNGRDTIMLTLGAVTGGTHTVSVYAINNCGNGTAGSTNIILNTPEVPQICMVTVDDSSTHNIIYWDKSPIIYADSFRIYREDATNVYTQIGTVHDNSLSEFHDYDSIANPNVTTKRYKISAVDSCGNESSLSPYHNTVYITDNGVGQFSWTNLYTIEGGPNPVNQYELWVDSLNDGNWALRASTAGTQQVINDIYYANYAGVANWRVETVWGISCTPTNRMAGGNGTQGTVVKSKSNITNNRTQTTGITNGTVLGLNVYPNPTTGTINVQVGGASKATVRITGLLGQVVYEKNLINANGVHSVDMSSFVNGPYVIQIITDIGIGTQKIVKQ